MGVGIKSYECIEENEEEVFNELLYEYDIVYDNIIKIEVESFCSREGNMVRGKIYYIKVKEA